MANPKAFHGVTVSVGDGPLDSLFQHLACYDLMKA
jgi:hypothetical protein